ncbi:hypothetical protein OH77DRAFT_1017991 [Trametes cingulata]|nr:hypothetical protein OH77DRAFT_1017991 [Trametes cingulata]
MRLRPTPCTRYQALRVMAFGESDWIGERILHDSVVEHLAMRHACRESSRTSQAVRISSRRAEQLLVRMPGTEWVGSDRCTHSMEQQRVCGRPDAIWRLRHWGAARCDFKLACHCLLVVRRACGSERIRRHVVDHLLMECALCLLAWRVQQRLISSQPESGDDLRKLLRLAHKAIKLLAMVVGHPDLAEEDRTTVSSWAGETLRKVQGELKSTDYSKVTWQTLRSLAFFLEGLVQVHTPAKPLVRSDFVIASRNFLDGVKSCPDRENVDHGFMESCEVALKTLESKRQSDNPVPSVTESRAFAVIDPPSTSQARASGSLSVCKQEEQVQGLVNPSDAIEPASLEPTSASGASLDAEAIRHSMDPSDAVEPADSEPTTSPGNPHNSCSDPASASQSPPSGRTQEQREGSLGVANLSHSGDHRPAPTSSSSPPLNAPLATRSDTTSRALPSLFIQDEQERSMPEQAGNSAETAKPSDSNHSPLEPTSGALSGVPLLSPAGLAIASRTLPSYPFQHIPEDSAPSPCHAIELRHDPAHTSASADA